MEECRLFIFQIVLPQWGQEEEGICPPNKKTYWQQWFLGGQNVQRREGKPNIGEEWDEMRFSNKDGVEAIYKWIKRFYALRRVHYLLGSGKDLWTNKNQAYKDHFPAFQVKHNWKVGSSKASIRLQWREYIIRDDRTPRRQEESMIRE